jgi:hypothetical protein
VEPRQQLVVGVVLAGLLIAVGIVRAGRRGGLLTAQGKVDFAYVLKLIPLSIAFSAVILSTALTMMFFLAWGLHADQPGSQPLPLDAFMPRGYAPHFAMTLLVVGALVTFALSLISYVDHVNTGTSTPRTGSGDRDRDEQQG